MKIEIELGVENAATLKKVVKSLKKMNEGEAYITPETVAKEVLKNYIASEYGKMLLAEK